MGIPTCITQVEKKAVIDASIMAGVREVHLVEEPMAAISAGIVGGTALVDLDYSEDHVADVDMNVVMTASGRYLEIQGTGESRPFKPEELDAILTLCRGGIDQVLSIARTALAEPLK